VAAVVVAAFLGLVVWLVVSTWQRVDTARADLASARAQIAGMVDVRTQLLSSNGRLTAAQSLEQVSQKARAAMDELRVSPGLDILGVLPYLHTQRDASIQLAQDVAQAAQDGQQLLTIVDTLATHSSGTTVALGDLTALDGQLGLSVDQMSAMDRPAHGLIGPLAQARQKFDGVDAKVVGLLSQGKQVVDYALPFLGADGPRTYLLAAENNAEMRDQGAVLSYAVLSTANGTYSVTRSQSVGALALAHPAPFTLPAGTAAVFGTYQPTLLWQSTNAPADFALSAADMQSMYQQVTGVKVDGVIGIDVPMVARLLRLTGPVRVPGIPAPVSAANVTRVLLHDLYAGEKPGTDPARKEELASVFQAVVDRLRAERIDPGELANTLAQGVATRDLLAWDDVGAYERTITRFGGSGAVDSVNPSRTFHVAVENATATKLDYYVRVGVSMHVVLTAGNHAVVQTAVTVANAAPAGAPPSYQLGPDGVSSTVAGQYVAHVYLYSPAGSDVENGTPESGLVLSERDVSVLAGQRATVNFETVIPDAVQHGHFGLELVPQPRLVPDRFAVSLSSHAWNFETAPTATLSLGKSEALRWSVVRSGTASP
jgi:hypothetical protein